MELEYAVRNTFPSIETPRLKQLYNAHRSIQTLCVLWILGLIFLFIMLMVSLFSPESTMEARLGWSAILIPLIGFYLATVIGCYQRKKWARICGIIACVFALPGFPIGSLLGIIGLFAFGRSPELFGLDRLDPDELIVEYKKRKQKHG